MSKITLSVDQIGRGSITLDGVDISKHVCAVSVHAQVGELTKIELTCSAEVEVLATEADVTLVEILPAEDGELSDVTTVADDTRRYAVRSTP